MKLTLDPGAAALLDALHAAGYAAYAVGGCVRDSLLGRTAHDWDLCTSALPQQVMELFGTEQCIPTGLQHGTVTIKYGGQLYETTTFRTEGSYTDGRHPDEVQFVPDVREDLARRDFTINAMAYNEAEGLVDPFGGLLAGGWFFYQGRQLYRSAASSYPVASMYDTICARGSYTSYDALPQIYINAVICTEDEHFMTHKGIDPGAIARALLADLRTHSLAEGGSTLTQQLAKNELFTQDKHLARKAAEMLAAFDIEKTYSKQQIFEMYANTIYFGSGYYGIAEASEGYFGKEPAQLTDVEAIYLAGMPNAPSTYASSPELAFKRMQVVLKRMVKCRVLTQQQADAIAADAENLTV